MTSLGDDLVAGHHGLFTSVVSLRGCLITYHLGTLTPSGVLGSSHHGGYTLRSDPFDVRVLKLGKLDIPPYSERFGILIPTGSGTPGLRVGSHRSYTLYFSF